MPSPYARWAVYALWVVAALRLFGPGLDSWSELGDRAIGVSMLLGWSELVRRSPQRFGFWISLSVMLMTWVGLCVLPAEQAGWNLDVTLAGVALNLLAGAVTLLARTRRLGAAVLAMSVVIASMLLRTLRRPIEEVLAPEESASSGAWRMAPPAAERTSRFV